MKTIKSILPLLVFDHPLVVPMIAHGADQKSTAARAVLGIPSPLQWNDEEPTLVKHANQQLETCLKRLRKAYGYLSDYNMRDISYPYQQ